MDNLVHPYSLFPFNHLKGHLYGSTVEAGFVFAEYPGISSDMVFPLEAEIFVSMREISVPFFTSMIDLTSKWDGE